MGRVLDHFFHQVAVNELDPIVVQETRDLLVLLDREAVEGLRCVDQFRDGVSRFRDRGCGIRRRVDWRDRGHDQGSVFTLDQAMIPCTTSPWTSVSRMSRPPKR